MIRTPRIAGAALAGLISAATAAAHVNPPLVLMTDHAAMAAALPAATTFAETQLKLTPQQKQTLRKEWRFQCEDRSYRVYQGRDAQGGLVGAVVILTQATIHSPLRVAVGVGKDGRVTGAAVVEVSEESYTWVKPLIDQGFTKAYVGQGARGEFKVPPGTGAGRARNMQAFYAKVIAYMVQWGAALSETAGLMRAS